MQPPGSAPEVMALTENVVSATPSQLASRACVVTSVTCEPTTVVASVENVAAGAPMPEITPLTTYHAVVPAATSVGTITQSPSAGGTGTITATVGSLAPGQSAVLSFGVRITP